MLPMTCLVLNYEPNAHIDLHIIIYHSNKFLSDLYCTASVTMKFYLLCLGSPRPPSPIGGQEGKVEGFWDTISPWLHSIDIPNRGRERRREGERERGREGEREREMNANKLAYQG